MGHLNFKQFLSEMAMPSDKDLSRSYYHGTAGANAQSIITKGLDPAHTEIKYADAKNHKMKPQAGKIYITPDIAYAQMYAIGGDIAGASIEGYLERDIAKNGRYGYVFEIPGSELTDIHPDEDTIGEFIMLSYYQQDVLDKHYNGWPHKTDKSIIYLKNEALKRLTDNQLKKVKDGDYASWAQAGKKLIKYLPDWVKLGLIDVGAHVAHTGALKPARAWKIDKTKIPLLKRDGSNFFDHAEEVKI